MNKRNKHIIISLVSVLLIDGLLVGYSYLFPELKLPSIGGKELTVKFMSSQALFDFTDKTRNTEADQLTDVYLEADSLRIHRIGKAEIDSAFLPRRDSIRQGGEIREVKLENPVLPDGTHSLDLFFEKLISERDTSVVHIAHYGDSQIEGDRISSVLRKNLQAKFGGEGTGFIPMDDIATCAAYTRISSPNWQRYNVFQHKIGTNLWGMSGTVYRYKKSISLILPDSITAAGDTVARPRKQVSFKSAYVDFRMNYPLPYKNLQLMYGNSNSNCRFRMMDGKGTELINDSLPASPGFSMYSLNATDGSLQQFKLEFSGEKSPDFYGLLMDGKNGVQVDNYAIRGHGGGGLIGISSSHLGRQAEMLNTRLIIFQYGNNLIPYLESDEECNYYEEVYYKLFLRFKKAIPGASLLVVGNGDMGTRIEGVNMSYPYVSRLDSVMKKAATRANCAYWSMLEAMGGENSILIWEKKGLASLDGHLSSRGQQIMANLLFRAIMEEYNNYIVRTKPVTAVK